MNENIDLDKNDSISPDELRIYRRKLVAQRNMATASLVSSMILTLLVLSPAIPVDRLAILTDIVVMYYIMAGSTVGAFMGFSTWMAKK
jgi:hypothetical protein